MPAQDVPVWIDDVPGTIAESFAQETSVIVVGDEADLLTLDGVMGLQSRLARDRAHLALFK